MGELTDKLREYSKSNFYPFHMPGHKRNIEALPNPYGYDITEIEGFDDLHEAEDVLDRLTKRFEEIYGAKKAYILVNGSTGGLHTSISAVTEKGDSILIARNSHKSVYNGVFLKELKCDYIYPQINKKTGINQAITAENVDKCLSENPLIKAVLITSPTYEGVVSDIKSIAKVVHGYNIPLIVDAAHGAHFGCGDFFPDNAIITQLEPVYEVYLKHQSLSAQTMKMEALDDLTVNRNSEINEFISALETKMQSSFALTDFTATAQGITMNVTVETKEEVAVVLDELRKLECFIFVDTTALSELTTEIGETQYSFAVEMLYAPIEKETEEGEE